VETIRTSEHGAGRRGATLEAVAFAAQRLLEEPDWQLALPEIVMRLAQAVDASRAYVYENRRSGGELRALLRSQWVADADLAVVTEGTELGYEGLERWVQTLGAGEVLEGRVDRFPPSERPTLEAHGVRSLLLVPIIVAGDWWGYIGFDDCVHERAWGPDETDALRAAAGTLAAAINRERSERRLREAEARFRSIVETTPVITYQEHLTKGYDAEGSVLYVSPQVERILGYSPRDWAEIPGFWSNLLHPDDRERVILESERTSRTGEPYRQEYRMIAADGRIVWFRDESVLLRDEEGRPLVWQGVMVDITERKEAEERLLEAEDVFRTVVEHLPAVTYREALDDPNPERFYMSPRSVEVFGYTPERWTWTPEFWEDHLHPDDRDRVLALDAETNRTHEPFVAEYRFRRADGTYVWIHDEAKLVERPGGEAFWQGFLLDITLRKDAESALAETEERYRLLVERSPVSIYVQDVDAATGGSVTTYLSPANEALIGYTSEEVAADPTLWTRLIHPDDRERVLAADRSSNADGGEFSLEYRVIHKDGHVVWVQDVATFLESGDRRYWQGFMLDITERKEAEAKLEQALAVERDVAQRLRALDDMKNTFLQAVSHDLRTPLAAILGLAVTLERSDIELEPTVSRDLAGRIAENARKLDRLVTDLLDLDRLARGIVEPKLHPTDVSEIVSRVVAASDLSSTGRVSVDAPAVVVNVDAAKVERIVENLLANAARHTPDDARVWVRVDRHDDGVLIAVDDDGPGVPEEMREELFEPFRQGPGAPDHAPGVGVGLALVARFAELMGGRAWVEERPGGGASFRVYLADGPRTSAEVGTAG
jgi:PAS domain S-box-containing protein